MTAEEYAKEQAQKIYAALDGEPMPTDLFQTAMAAAFAMGAYVAIDRIRTEFKS
jgi:hypothetical protein